MKPFTLKKRKKREVWVLENHGHFRIMDPNTEKFFINDSFVKMDWSEDFWSEWPTRDMAVAYAKRQGWVVI